MMDCRQVRSALPLHAGGDLSHKEAREVEQHLAGCPQCRTEAEAWRGDFEQATDLLNRPEPTQLDQETLEAQVTLKVEKGELFLFFKIF